MSCVQHQETGKFPTVFYFIISNYTGFYPLRWGWSGGAKVLGKLPVPGRPTDLDYSRARAYCACGRCGWGLFGHFFSHLSLFLSPSLWETARYRLKYCLKGPLSPKQPTNPLRLRQIHVCTSILCNSAINGVSLFQNNSKDLNLFHNMDPDL